jgi:chromosome segregation ATPase
MALGTGKKDEIKRLEEMVDILKGEIAVLAQQLESQNDQLSIKDRQIEQLHILMRQAQAALPPPSEARQWWRLWDRGPARSPSTRR